VRELEVLGHDIGKSFMHMRQLLGRWIHSVPAPHDHRHRANLAFGDPTNIVFVKPGRDARGLTQIATIDAFELHALFLAHVRITRRWRRPLHAQSR